MAEKNFVEKIAERIEKELGGTIESMQDEHGMQRGEVLLPNGYMLEIARAEIWNGDTAGILIKNDGETVTDLKTEIDWTRRLDEDEIMVIARQATELDPIGKEEMTVEELLGKCEKELGGIVTEWGGPKERPIPLGLPPEIAEMMLANIPHGWGVLFPNGYIADITDKGYGSEDGLLEIAVMSADREILYDTPITDDVIGYLTEERAFDIARQISELPPREREQEVDIETTMEGVKGKMEEIGTLLHDIYLKAGDVCHERRKTGDISALENYKQMLRPLIEDSEETKRNLKDATEILADVDRERKGFEAEGNITDLVIKVTLLKAKMDMADGAINKTEAQFESLLRDAKSLTEFIESRMNADSPQITMQDIREINAFKDDVADAVTKIEQDLGEVRKSMEKIRGMFGGKEEQEKAGRNDEDAVL